MSMAVRATADRPRRIVVTGPECTGKTTLAREIGDALGAPVVAEAARLFAEWHAGPLSLATVAPIARLSMQLEDEALAVAGPGAVLVRDTDLISTVVYSRHYYGTVEPWIADEAARRRADLYLLCAPDIPWVADGIRDRPMQREELYTLFERRLAGSGAPVAPIAGLGPARAELAMAAIRSAGLSAPREASR